MKKYPRYSNAEMRQIIENWIHSEKHRRMLFLRLIDGLTLEEIAEEMQIDVSTVKRNLNRYENEVFSHIEIKSHTK